MAAEIYTCRHKEWEAGRTLQKPGESLALRHASGCQFRALLTYSEAHQVFRVISISAKELSAQSQRGRGTWLQAFHFS